MFFVDFKKGRDIFLYAKENNYSLSRSEIDNLVDLIIRTSDFEYIYKFILEIKCLSNYNYNKLITYLLEKYDNTNLYDTKLFNILSSITICDLKLIKKIVSKISKNNSGFFLHKIATSDIIISEEIMNELVESVIKTNDKKSIFLFLSSNLNLTIKNSNDLIKKLISLDDTAYYVSLITNNMPFLYSDTENMLVNMLCNSNISIATTYFTILKINDLRIDNRKKLVNKFYESNDIEYIKKFEEYIYKMNVDEQKLYLNNLIQIDDNYELINRLSTYKKLGHTIRQDILNKVKEKIKISNDKKLDYLYMLYVDNDLLFKHFYSVNIFYAELLDSDLFSPNEINNIKTYIYGDNNDVKTLKLFKTK